MGKSEPSCRRPQTFRDDRPSLCIQASKQESFPQLNPIELPKLGIWAGKVHEQQAAGHSEVSKDWRLGWRKSLF